MVCKSSDKQLGQPTAKEKALNYGRMVATTQANSNKMLSKVLACKHFVAILHVHV